MASVGEHESCTYDIFHQPTSHQDDAIFLLLVRQMLLAKLPEGRFFGPFEQHDLFVCKYHRRPFRFDYLRRFGCWPEPLQAEHLGLPAVS